MKRVPMDFDWPLGRVWKGFLNPYEGCKCPWCYDEKERESLGYTKEAREYKRQFYGFQMGWDYKQNPYDLNLSYCPQAKPYRLERWEYDFIVSNEKCRSIYFGNLTDSEIPPFEQMTDYLLRTQRSRVLGGDAAYYLMMEHCRRLGTTDCCPHCEGTGLVWQTEEVHRLHDEWERIEPPTGDGYQLWETTSEGSPSSPVFATFDELCEWCAENATTFASYKATKEEWAQMLNDDFVCHQQGNVIMM